MYSWSQTAASNSNADSAINWAEGQLPSTVNDSGRGMMSILAKWRDDISGVQPSNVVQTSGGAANVQTLTTNGSIAALTNGWTLTFKAGFTNSAACTLNVDSLGAKSIQRISGTALAGGELIAGCVYTVTYHQPADAWILHSSGTVSTLSANLSAASFSLGTSTSQAADLFLEEGGVINWDNGDATITQTANDITIAGITTFGVGTSTAVTLGTIELGAASDTTIARSSAGVATIEGAEILTGNPLSVAKGGTGQATAAEAVGELIQALTEDVAPDFTADYVGTYEASTDTGKKVALSTLLRPTTSSAPIGYASGAGAAVTQLTSKSTGVTINAICGTITTDNANMASLNSDLFTVTNSTVASTDVVVLSCATAGADDYQLTATSVANGSFKILITNMSGGNRADAIAINFAVIKAVAA
jgi:hypothetical protein